MSPSEQSGPAGSGSSGAVRPGRAQQLAADLLDLISSELSQPGMKLPTEAELSERFGVSRTVVREAIARLRADGVVRSVQGRGTFVLAEPSEHKLSFGSIDTSGTAGLLDLLELRIAIETEASSLAARNRTTDQLRQIEEALEQFGNAADPGEAVEADFHFHWRIGRASGNPHFPAALESIGLRAFAVPRERLRGGEHALDRAYDEHALIHTAIAIGDQAGAAAAMRAHLSASTHRLHSS